MYVPAFNVHDPYMCKERKFIKATIFLFGHVSHMRFHDIVPKDVLNLTTTRISYQGEIIKNELV